MIFLIESIIKHDIKKIETSKPVIQGVRSKCSILKDKSSLPKTTLIRPERGQPCSVIKLVKVHSTKSTKEGPFVRKEPSLNPTNLGAISQGSTTLSESIIEAATTPKAGAVIPSSTSSPKIALSNISSDGLSTVLPITSIADELFSKPTFHIIAEVSLPANKRSQSGWRDNSKPVIFGIPPSRDRILNDNTEPAKNTFYSKDTTIKNDKHRKIPTKSSGEYTGVIAQKHKKLRSERKTGIIFLENK